MEIRLSLVGDPDTAVATLALELVEQTGVYTIAPCLAGGAAMFLAETDGPQGDGFIDADMLAVSLGAWSAARASADLVEVGVDPSGQESGAYWRFAFSSRRLGMPLEPGVHEMAEREGFEAEAKPGMDVGGDSTGCNTLQGRFQIHEYERGGGGAASLTASFEQRCGVNKDTGVLRGCVHYEE